MSDDLRDKLTDIRGVGDATADSIIDVLDAHGGLTSELENAVAAAEDGDQRTTYIWVSRHISRNGGVA